MGSLVSPSVVCFSCNSTRASSSLCISMHEQCATECNGPELHRSELLVTAILNATSSAVFGAERPRRAVRRHQGKPKRPFRVLWRQRPDRPFRALWRRRGKPGQPFRARAGGSSAGQCSPFEHPGSIGSGPRSYFRRQVSLMLQILEFPRPETAESPAKLPRPPQPRTVF